MRSQIPCLSDPNIVDQNIQSLVSEDLFHFFYCGLLSASTKVKFTLMEASLSSNLTMWIDLFDDARAFRSEVPELSGSRTVAKMCSISDRWANWRTKPKPMPWFVPVTNTETILDQMMEAEEFVCGLCTETEVDNEQRGVFGNYPKQLQDTTDMMK